jgi:hypothetical protein
VTLTTDGLEILTEPECRHLLAGGKVGRVVVTVGGVSAVFPVIYAVVGGDIVFFTGEGTKLSAATHGSIVSFEVDEFDLERATGWSVLAVGPATSASDVLADRARALQCFPLAAGDRRHAVRIRPEFLAGRRVALSTPDPR